MSPRRRAPRHLGGAVDAVVSRVAPATPIARLSKRWVAAVGKEIAARAEPTGERDGVFTIVCESSVWANELSLMHDDLLAAVRRELPGEKVQALRFRTRD